MGISVPLAGYLGSEKSNVVVVAVNRETQNGDDFQKMISTTKTYLQKFSKTGQEILLVPFQSSSLSPVESIFEKTSRLEKVIDQLDDISRCIYSEENPQSCNELLEFVIKYYQTVSETGKRIEECALFTSLPELSGHIPSIKKLNSLGIKFTYFTSIYVSPVAKTKSKKLFGRQNNLQPPPSFVSCLHTEKILTLFNEVVPPKYPFEVSVSIVLPDKGVYDLYEDVTLEVTIAANESLKGYFLEFYENAYFEKKYLPIDVMMNGSTKSYPLQLKCLLSENNFPPLQAIDKIHEKLKLRAGYSGKTGRIPLAIDGVKLQLRHFLYRILSRASKNANALDSVVIFGPTGAGKSSLINSFRYLICDEFRNGAFSAQSDDQVTRELSTFTLPGIYSLGLPFKFLDTVGVRDYEYKYNFHTEDMVNVILDGNAPLTVDWANMLDADGKITLSSIRAYIQSSNQRVEMCEKPKAVLFVIEYATLEDELIMQKILEIKSYLFKRAVHPIIAITKIDRLNKEADQNREKNKAINKLGIKPVYLVSSYTQDNRVRTFSRDKQLVELLFEIKNACEDYNVKSAANQTRLGSKVAPQPRVATQPTVRQRRIRALYNYTKTGPNQLSFEAGDIMEVLSENDERGEWPIVRMQNGEVGEVPPSYFASAV